MDSDEKVQLKLKNSKHHQNPIQASRMFRIYRKKMNQIFATTVGVRQGWLLSPCMFNLFLEQIMTQALEDFEGTVSVGSRKVNNLRFTDDIDLLGGSNEDLTDLTRRLDRIATVDGMGINEEKRFLGWEQVPTCLIVVLPEGNMIQLRRSSI